MGIDLGLDQERGSAGELDRADDLHHFAVARVQVGVAVPEVLQIAFELLFLAEVANGGDRRGTEAGHSGCDGDDVFQIDWHSGRILHRALKVSARWGYRRGAER